MLTNNEPSSPQGRVVLTWRRRRVLQAIEDYVADHGCSPSNRDIAKAADLKSASSVQQTQRSFSRLRSLVPSLRAAVTKRSRRSSAELEKT